MTHRPPGSLLLVAVLAVLAAAAGACTGESPATPREDAPGDDSASDEDGSGDADGDLPETLACTSEDALRLYTQRIAPLVTEDRVDSCNKCHFAGVELRSFMRETPCDSMACMDKLGIVDLDAPEQSLVLGWIKRGEPDSGLITDTVVQQEHDAFLEWIRYSARCNETVCEAPAADVDPCGGQTELVEPSASASTLLAGCDEAAITQAFTEKVFAWQGRCAHCHSTAYPLPPPLVGKLPQWMAPEDHPDAPRRTMLNLLALGAVDLEHPTQSRLLLKPLSIATGGMDHGGGDKFESPDEPAYQDFLAWIELYVSCTTRAPEPLPDEPDPIP